MNSVYYHFHNSEYFFETAMSGGRKKQKFADSAELFLSPTKLQWLEVIKIEDYY